MELNERKDINGAEHNNYNYSISCPLSRIHTMFKHVDLFIISIAEEDKEDIIDQALKGHGFQVKEDKKIKNGNYEMNRVYWNRRDSSLTLNLLHNLRDKNRPLPALLLTVHDPHIEFINLMRSMFSYHEIESKLSKVELAFDFYTDELWPLFLFFKTHLYLKHQRTPSNEYYETTYYVNDVRKSGYGVKVYIRQIEKLVRVELTLKSKILKRLCINSFLDSIDNIDLTKFFSFKVFDERRLRDYMLGKCKRDIEAANERRSNEGQLVIAHIDGWLRSAVHGRDSLMWKVELLKSERGVMNYLRYFSDFEELNEAFRKEVSSQTFIKSRHSV